jgi:acyl-CoA thioesterase FadM
VTARLEVRYLKPTPLNQPLHLHAVVEEQLGRKARVYCTLGPAGEITAEGHVVAVQIDADKAIGAKDTG